jgi:hypothetical protein
MRITPVIATLIAAALLAAACSPSTRIAKENVVGIPEWVVHPEVKDAIAATECVLWSGDISVDTKQAVANARATIAQQIQVRVRAMDKTYISKTGARGIPTTGGVFESVSRQVTERTLTGTTQEKMGIIPIEGKKHLCSMVVYGSPQTQQLFDRLIEESRVELSQADRAILWDEFRAQKAHEELAQEFNKKPQ